MTIRRWLLLAATFPITCGAVKLGNLHKPEHDEYFVLETDYTHVAYFGFRHVKALHGLRAGTYRLVAEDKEGQYFLGPVNCVIMVSGEDLQKYEATGETPSLETLNSRLLVPWTGTEGIWLPREGVKKEARFIVETHNSTNGQAAGLIGTAIVQLTEGTLLLMPFPGEVKHFSEVPRIAGTPPAAQRDGQ